MHIAAKDPDDYVASVPEERRPHLEQIRKLVKATVPEADERILWGMIGYELHGRPFAAVASQKASMSLYLMDLYTQPELKREHEAALKKVAMGKSCLHFNRADDLPLDVVRKILAQAPSVRVDLGTLAVPPAKKAAPRAKKPARPKVVALHPAPAPPKKLSIVKPAGKTTAKTKKTTRKPT